MALLRPVDSLFASLSGPVFGGEGDPALQKRRGECDTGNAGRKTIASMVPGNEFLMLGQMPERRAADGEKLFRGEGRLKEIEGRVIALGFFDGVHLGHASLLEMARKRAEEWHLTPAVMSFDLHPDNLVAGAKVSAD